ncbi:MAG: 2-oxo acid dehydrogenase subunit E2 [Pseudomonadales bacterium]|nr:2-oxo acid dehydrogenase subunit E2 [Pseudomonadales bacterium]
MPKLAMAMNEGTVNEWLVNDGDFVNEGDTIVVVETEKVSYDLQSPGSGYLKIIVQPGDTVPVYAPIALFMESPEGEAPEAGQNESPAAAAPVQQNKPAAKAGRIKASPVVRKLARELGVDLSTVEGSGPGGRIVKRDIEAISDSHPKTEPAKQPVERVASSAAGQQSGTAEKFRFSIKGTTRTSIARHMMQSVQETAQLSSNWESDLTELIRVRETYLAREERYGTRVSMNGFIVRAMVYAVGQVPIANSAMQGDEIVIYEDINLGMAVAMPGANEYDSSLIVPVLDRVQDMGVVELDRRLKELTRDAQARKLGADQMTGSTITLSSTYGIAPPGSANTPILNTPNAVIVGPSTPIERVVARDGEAVIRTMLPLSVTFDHRIMDGEPAARFMSHLHDAIEHPELMLA